MTFLHTLCVLVAGALVFGIFWDAGLFVRVAVILG